VVHRCSVSALQLRVTQLVDGVKGFHAMILKSIFHETSAGGGGPR
jgi:hypothetical protein